MDKRNRDIVDAPDAELAVLINGPHEGQSCKT